MVAMEYCSCAGEVLVLEVFMRAAGSSLEGLYFFLLLS
jgi:hypothetical protein